MKKSLCIILPVLNEEKRIENGLNKTITYLDELDYNEYQIIVVDNGSTDKTEEIARKVMRQSEHVSYIHTKEKGVGLAFRTGVEKTDKNIVGYMDIDLSTDITHLKEVIDIFDSDNTVDMVNASRWNVKSDTQGRKWYRNITSHGLTLMLKMLLGMKATDSICGFKFFKQESVKRLIAESGDENGWFYIIELLLRAEKDNMKVVELPVRWKDDYNSKVNVWKVTTNYLCQIAKLRKTFKKERIK